MTAERIIETPEEEVSAVLALARGYCNADGLIPFDQLPHEEKYDEIVAAWRALESLKAAGFTITRA